MNLRTFVKKDRKAAANRLSVEEIGPIGEDRFIEVVMKLEAADFWRVFLRDPCILYLLIIFLRALVGEIQSNNGNNNAILDDATYVKCAVLSSSEKTDNLIDKIS